MKNLSSKHILKICDRKIEISTNDTRIMIQYISEISTFLYDKEWLNYMTNKCSKLNLFVRNKPFLYKGM